MSVAAAPDDPPEPTDALDSSGSSLTRLLQDEQANDVEATPQIYLACPLTGLDIDDRRREETSYRVAVVESAVFEATVGDRTDGGKWPVRLHVPFHKTRPGADGDLGPATVYDRNLDSLLSSDGLIIVTDEHCSAGVGQEFEWAVRAAIPVLYLSRALASRQLRGTPHNVDARVFDDAHQAALHVQNWLHGNRTQIRNGPGRRAGRDLAYAGLTARLAIAWGRVSNRTDLAAQLNLHPGAVDNLVRSSSRVALTPWWTICELAVLLGVRLEARRGLTFAESRAWVTAAEASGWDTRTAERVRIYGAVTGAVDLELPATWTALHDRMRAPGPLGA